MSPYHGSLLTSVSPCQGHFLVSISLSSSFIVNLIVVCYVVRIVSWHSSNLTCTSSLLRSRSLGSSCSSGLQHNVRHAAELCVNICTHPSRRLISYSPSLPPSSTSTRYLLSGTLQAAAPLERWCVVHDSLALMCSGGVVTSLTLLSATTIRHGKRLRLLRLPTWTKS